MQGFWPLEKTENGTLVLAGNSDGYVSNWFASGSKPRMQGSGIAFLGNYGDTNVDNDFGLAIEHEATPQLSEKTGEGHYQDGETAWIPITMWIPGRELKAELRIR